MKKSYRILVAFARLAAFALLCSPQSVKATSLGSPVPKPTAVNQYPVSAPYAGGFVWTPVTLPWLTNGSQSAFGGAIDTTSRLSVNPQGTGENGLTVNMPSGATGTALRVKNSTGSDILTITAAGAINTDPGYNNVHIGYGSNAGTGGACTAIGYNAQADGYNSFAMGFNTQAHNGGFAMGASTSANGGGLISIGNKITNNSAATIIMGFGSNVDGPGYLDTNLYFNGVTNSVTQPFTIQPAGQVGTDAIGASLTIAGGKGTGAGIGGKVYAATSSAGATGTTLNALVNRASFSSTGMAVLTGSLSLPVRIVTAADTATLTDSVLLCNGTFTETLPATGYPTGYRLTVKDTGTGTITLTAGGTVTFDGATTITFATQYKSRVFIFDGVNFAIESGYL